MKLGILTTIVTLSLTIAGAYLIYNFAGPYTGMDAIIFSGSFFGLMCGWWIARRFGRTALFVAAICSFFVSAPWIAVQAFVMNIHDDKYIVMSPLAIGYAMLVGFVLGSVKRRYGGKPRGEPETKHNNTLEQPGDA
ncbi:MAG: hypothetical protein AAF438_19220 [Pseudomonadota bacterium]